MSAVLENLSVVIDILEREHALLPCHTAYVKEALEALATPVPMILTCPSCGARHIDKGNFATKPHHTHACQACGMCWRPAVAPTVGVQFLPGFKDEAQ
jgi:predicted RNA-binding Zn-ribbon protein involved in translation (DUF1610 family)